MYVYSLNATFEGYLPWTADVHSYSINDFVQVRTTRSIHNGVVVLPYLVLLIMTFSFDCQCVLMYVYAIFFHRSGWNCAIWSPFSLTLLNMWIPVLWVSFVCGMCARLNRSCLPEGFVSSAVVSRKRFCLWVLLKSRHHISFWIGQSQHMSRLVRALVCILYC